MMMVMMMMVVVVESITILAKSSKDERVSWNTQPNILGKFDWGVRYVIIFLHVQFWIQLAAVSYRGKKIRTVASPAMRSVNTSRDTRNCVQNEPEYAIRVIFTTLLYYKALGIIYVLWYGKYATITIVLTISTVMLHVTARCQHWARPVPWWQPMKIP